MATKPVSISFYSTSYEIHGKTFELMVPNRIPPTSAVVRFFTNHFSTMKEAEGKFGLKVNGGHYLIQIQKKGTVYSILDFEIAKSFRKGPKRIEKFPEYLTRFPDISVLLGAPEEKLPTDDRPPPSQVVEPQEASLEIPKESFFNGIRFFSSDEVISNRAFQNHHLSLNDHLISPEVFFAVRKNTARFIRKKKRFKNGPFQRQALDRFFRVGEKILGVFGWIEREERKPISYIITTMYYLTESSLKQIFKFSSKIQRDERVSKFPEIHT